MTTHPNHHAAPRPPSEWMREAACLGVADLPWTTDTADRTGPALLGQIMADTCAACPLRAECAAYADDHDICGGFWAGADRAVSESAPEVWVPIRHDGGQVVEEQAAIFPSSNPGKPASRTGEAA